MNSTLNRFVFSIVACCVMTSCDISNSKQSYKQNRYQDGNNINTVSISTTSYCNLSQDETIEYLTSSSFSLNGNGHVGFNTSYDYARDSHVPSTISISGNGYRLQGTWKHSVDGRIKVDNLRAVSGYFDASNNSTTRGSFVIECNGNLSGGLVDPNGNTNQLRIIKS